VQRAAANTQKSKCISKICSCCGFSANAKKIGTKGKQNTFKRECKCEAQGKVSKSNIRRNPQAGCIPHHPTHAPMGATNSVHHLEVQ